MEHWIQRITIFSVFAVGLLVAFFAGISSGDGNVVTVLSICGIFAVILIYFGFYKYYWICAVAFLFFQGNFNFIPGGFQAFEIVLILGVFRFAIDHIIFRQNAIRTGPLFEFLLICSIMIIIMMHGAKDRFGMRVLGSSVWGGRAYVEALFGFSTYIILQTTRFDLKAWRFLPLVAFIPSVIDAAINILTRYIPSLVMVIYPLYSGVNTTGLEQFSFVDTGDVTSTAIQESRLGALGAIGLPIALVIFSYVPIKNLWRPQYWLAAVLLLAGGVLCVLTGYRSSILAFLVVALAAFLKDFKWKVWIPIALGSILLAGIISFHSYGGWKMPLSAQRALVFLPGEWDSMAVESAKGSDEFRFETWDRWYREYFEKNPVLGRGFGFPISARKTIWGSFDSANDKSLRESLALVGELHNGFISVVDRIGVLGFSIFFVWWCSTLWRIFQSLTKSVYLNFNPALTWVGLYLANWTFLYSFGSLKFDHFIGPQLVLSAVLVRMMREADEKVLKDKQEAIKARAIEEAGPLIQA